MAFTLDAFSSETLQCVLDNLVLGRDGGGGRSLYWSRSWGLDSGCGLCWSEALIPGHWRLQLTIAGAR